MGHGVVNRRRTGRADTALRGGRAAAPARTVVTWLPSVGQLGPENVVVPVEDVRLGLVLGGKHGVALAEMSFAGTGRVVTHSHSSFKFVDVEVVFLELPDASFSVRFAGTFQTILVFLANSVQSIDWWTKTRVGHRSVTEHEAVAAIGPILSLVKSGVEVVHHSCQLPVAARLVGGRVVCVVYVPR